MFHSHSPKCIGYAIVGVRITPHYRHLDAPRRSYFCVTITGSLLAIAIISFQQFTRNTIELGFSPISFDPSSGHFVVITNITPLDGMSSTSSRF